MPTQHLILPELTPKQISRFWRKVHKGAADHCWPWVGKRITHGYGCVHVQGAHYAAHRIAYLLAHGRFAPELCVMHTCDNPPCVNPSHLRLGTHATNMADMFKKGRTYRAIGHEHWTHRHPERIARGGAVGGARLSAQDVTCIRRQYAAGGISFRALGLKYNVHAVNIWQIVRRKTWKHLD